MAPTAEGLLAYWTLPEYRTMSDGYQAVAKVFYGGNVRKARREIKRRVADPLKYWKYHHHRTGDIT